MLNGFLSNVLMAGLLQLQVVDVVIHLEAIMEQEVTLLFIKEQVL